VPELLISPMTANDAAVVASLSQQLGYPSTAEKIRANLDAVRAFPDAEVLVALELPSREVKGWIHRREERSLTSGVRAEIVGLIVAEDRRGQGIGAALMAAGEWWAQGRGISEIRLHSRITRPDAHRFYQGNGYRVDKTSHFFVKSL